MRVWQPKGLSFNMARKWIMAQTDIYWGEAVWCTNMSEHKLQAHPLPCDVIHCMTAKRSLDTKQSKISSNSSLDSVRHHSVILQYFAHKIVIKSCKTSQLHRSILRVAWCNKNKSFFLISAVHEKYIPVWGQAQHIWVALHCPFQWNLRHFCEVEFFSRKWTVSKF